MKSPHRAGPGETRGRHTTLPEMSKPLRIGGILRQQSIVGHDLSCNQGSDSSGKPEFLRNPANRGARRDIEVGREDARIDHRFVDFVETPKVDAAPRERQYDVVVRREDAARCANRDDFGYCGVLLEDEFVLQTELLLKSLCAKGSLGGVYHYPGPVREALPSRILDFVETVAKEICSSHVSVICARGGFHFA